MNTSVLDARPPSRGSRAVVAGIGAGALHAGAVAAALVFGARAVVRDVPPAVSELVEIELPAKKADAPPEPVEQPPIPRDDPPPPPRREPAKSAPPLEAAPPPEAARAGQVLTASEDVVDFGETFVSRTGKSHVGGVTQARGTADRAVRAASARPGGVPGGSGAVLGADRSRPATLAGGFTWDCPFPSEADDARVDHAVVSLRIHVGARGEVLRVIPKTDPGNGFAREARRCAMSKRWAPGLDRDGVPQPSVTVVRVRFDR